MDPMTLILIIGGGIILWKSGILNKFTGGGQQSISTSNGEYASVDSSGGKTDIDVSGKNACACANGVCKGNCSSGGGIYTGTGMSPKEFVKSHVPQAYFAHRAYRSTWGWGW